MNNSFSIIKVDDLRWAETVNKSINFDFHHTQSYHLLEKEHHPLLFVANFYNDFIAIPLLLRKIPNSNYFDFTSVYGYSGPICNKDFNLFSSEELIFFKDELQSFFKKNNIVSVFSRLHPLIDYGNLFENFGEIKNLNKTIAIDLKSSPEEQRKQYRKSNKSEINQLRNKHGFEIMVATSKEDIDSFISIYNETMIRVEAKDNYFFDKEYFYSFLDNTCFESVLLLSKKDADVTAGAIFTITNGIMQYHLAGTKKEYIKFTPMKLILDEARILGNQLKLNYLHLGGGVSGSDQDSLFRFKVGFSKNLFQFQVWQHIVDIGKYEELIQLNSITAENNYFPLYRS